MGTSLEQQLLCGAATVDITPPAGTHLAGSGNGNRRGAQVVLDRLYARAIVFESGTRRMCIVAMDVTIVAEEYTSRIRQAAAQWHMTPDAVMVHGTQTHSAPAFGNFLLDSDFPIEINEQNQYLRGGEDHFAEMACERAIKAIGLAVENLQPVSVGYGRTIAPGWAFNRRGVNREGKITMPSSRGRYEQPFGDTNLAYIEGPDDPELGVICFRTDDLHFPAMLLNFTCHPVIVFSYGKLNHTYMAVSSDWPGTLAAALENNWGPGCVPVVINGACGNINPRNPWDPEFFPTQGEMGSALAAKADKVLSSLHFSPNAPIDWQCEHVQLDFRDIPDWRQKEVDQILTENPTPVWNEETGNVDPRWFRAATTKSVELCRKRMGTFPYEIQVFRIGDAVIVGLPGEPFVEGQLAIKINSPAAFPYVAHMISHYVGYLPHRDAYERFGHEANEDVTYWAKFAPGSLEKVVDRARSMVENLFNSQSQ